MPPTATMPRLDRWGSRASLLLLLTFATATAACSDSPVDPAADAVRQILFVSDRGGGRDPVGEPLRDIYRTGEDGVGVENLTRAPARSYRHLGVSPDGSRLVFESDRSGCYNIWTMAPDGTAPVQLTGAGPGERCNESPRWSTDGSLIAFSTSREPIERSWEVYVMAADGSGARNVSDNAGLEVASSDWPHGWTPDGRLVFESYRVGEPVATYVVRPDGTGLEPFFSRLGDHSPYWSPDGSRIAFVSERAGNPDLFLVEADGTAVRPLTRDPGIDTFEGADPRRAPADPWSPDGARLAFVSERDGNREVYVVRADGTGLVNVTNDPGADAFNGWSPDGGRIAFTSDRGGQRDVYTVKPDGTDVVNVTAHPADDRYGVWGPLR